MRFSNVPFEAVDTASQNFTALVTTQVWAVSALATFSENTAAGTLKLQASNDYATAGDLAPFTPSNWVDIPNTSQTITAGASVLIPFTQVCYNYIRVVFTKSGGAGTMNVNVALMAY